MAGRGAVTGLSAPKVGAPKPASSSAAVPSRERIRVFMAGHNLGRPVPNDNSLIGKTPRPPPPVGTICAPEPDALRGGGPDGKGITEIDGTVSERAGLQRRPACTCQIGAGFHDDGDVDCAGDGESKLIAPHSEAGVGGLD